MATAVVEKSPFQILENSRFNSYEVTFEGKPSEAVRNALKALKMRWNPKRLVWYGFATEYQIRSAILKANGEAQEAPAEEATSILAPGYLGAIAVYGSKSGKHLYGAELSAAIRKDLKAAGLKATVKVETYSGGQHIYVTLQVKASDYISQEEFLNNYKISPVLNWITCPDGSQMHVEKFYSAEVSDEEREAITTYNALEAYRKAWRTGHDYNHTTVNHYHLDSLEKSLGMFTEAARERMKAACNIVSAYRYDASNSMVDYYDTNFYYDVRLKNADYKEA